MRPIDLNFAGTPFRNNTPYYLGYGLGALVLVIFTVFNAWAFVHYSRGNDTLGAAYAANRAKLESLRKESADLQAKIDKFDLGSMNSRAAFTNALLDRRRFSWTDLLNSLEEAQVYQVRLLSLIPRIQEKGILIDARAVAQDLKAMWNFQQNLQIHPKFRRVYPGGWTKSNEQGEIVFNLAFNYFPEGAPEGAQGLTPQEAGLEEFQEAPGPGGESGDEAQNTDDLPAEEPPPPPSKNPSKTAAVGSATAAPSAGNPARGAASAPNTAKVVPDPRRPERGKESIPGMVPADSPTAAAANPAAAPAAGASLRPPLTGFPTMAQPAGPTGATGASGVPTRRLGRGLPPGSGGVRPPPPPKTEVPTIPVAVPKDQDPGDDQ